MKFNSHLFRSLFLPVVLAVTPVFEAGSLAQTPAPGPPESQLIRLTKPVTAVPLQPLVVWKISAHAGFTSLLVFPETVQNVLVGNSNRCVVAPLPVGKATVTGSSNPLPANSVAVRVLPGEQTLQTNLSVILQSGTVVFLVVSETDFPEDHTHCVYFVK